MNSNVMWRRHVVMQKGNEICELPPMEKHSFDGSTTQAKTFCLSFCVLLPSCVKPRFPNHIKTVKYSEKDSIWPYVHLLLANCTRLCGGDLCWNLFIFLFRFPSCFSSSPCFLRSSSVFCRLFSPSNRVFVFRPASEPRELVKGWVFKCRLLLSCYIHLQSQSCLFGKNPSVVFTKWFDR